MLGNYSMKEARKEGNEEERGKGKVGRKEGGGKGMSWTKRWEGMHGK